MKLKKLNKKGQFESALLAIITIVIIGIILFFMNHLNQSMYAHLDDYFNDSKYNDTEAHDALQDIKGLEEGRMWDYAFLAIFVGLALQIILFSFATRISPAFFWIMLIFDLPILMIGVALSNIWQELASDPVFAETILRFPFTNSILGTYYPMAVLFIMFISSIILFGKRPDQP